MCELGKFCPSFSCWLLSKCRLNPAAECWLVFLLKCGFSSTLDACSDLSQAGKSVPQGSHFLAECTLQCFAVSMSSVRAESLPAQWANVSSITATRVLKIQNHLKWSSKRFQMQWWVFIPKVQTYKSYFREEVGQNHFELCLNRV